MKRTLSKVYLKYLRLPLLLLSSQILAYLAKGEKDELVGGRITILQTIAFISLFFQFLFIFPAYYFQNLYISTFARMLGFILSVTYSLFAGSLSFETQYSSRALLSSILVLLGTLWDFYYDIKTKTEVTYHISSADLKIPSKVVNHLFDQGLWILFAGLPLYIVNADQATERLALVATDIFGWLFWIIGFIIKYIEFYQRDSSSNGELFSNGIRKYSRNPSYFGDILLWIGITFLSIEALDGTQFIALFSPFYVFMTIYFFTIPSIENDDKLKSSDEYQLYKERTNRLLILPFNPFNISSKGKKSNQSL